MKLFLVSFFVLIKTFSFAQTDSTGSLLIYGKNCGLSKNNKFEEGGESYLYFKDGLCMFNISKILKSPAIFPMLNFRNNRIGDSSNYDIHFQWNPKNASSILFHISITGNRKNASIEFLHTETYCNFVHSGDKKKEAEITRLFSIKSKMPQMIGQKM